MQFISDLNKSAYQTGLKSMDQQQIHILKATQAQPDGGNQSAEDASIADLKKQQRREKLLQKLKLSSEEIVFHPQFVQVPINTNYIQENQDDQNDDSTQVKKSRSKKKNKQNAEQQEDLVNQILPQKITNNNQQQIEVKSQQTHQVANGHNPVVQDQQQTDRKNRRQDNQYFKEDSQSNQQIQQVTNRSNKNKLSNQNHSSSYQLVQQESNHLKNTQTNNLNHNNQNDIIKDKQSETKDQANQLKDAKTGKKNIVILQSEKQKQKKQGYYSKINYNLSEIIEKQIIPIKLEEKQHKDQVQQQTDEKLIDSIQVHVLGKNPKKQKNKSLVNQQQKPDKKEKSLESLKVQKQEKQPSISKTQQNQKLKDNQSIIKINDLDVQISQIQEQIILLQEQQKSNSGWNTEILSEKELKEVSQKMKSFQQKLDDLILKKDLIILQEKQQKEQLIQQQQERKKQRYLRKLKRLGFLKNIAKEVALFKIKKGIPHPRQNRVIKYKAVPENQLDFELIEKKKKKVSKIKTSLKIFQEQENFKKSKAAKEHENKIKQQDTQNEDDHFETVAEDESNDEDKIQSKEDKEFQQDQIKNNTSDEDFKEDTLFENPQVQSDKESPQIYKLPPHINEDHNLENFKYNNMYLRNWVDHMPNQDIDNLVLTLVNDLAYKQAMKKLNDPKKFKKRIVAGFKEVLSTLTTNVKEKKSKCIIIALNIQKNPLENGSDQLVLQIINHATQKKIPIIHSCSRARLGKAFTGKFGPRISVLSVLNYEGLADQVNQLEELVNNQRINYFSTYKKPN
ncbi:ribosomal protein L7Ae containing protein (macronuclear) [Tetrahymena thermophila SB210]|uniref:Ribosomal protein L7Ae containing protein n=1 Tax=Tetrahymena thermophila (strain SB210) TaxID=312017 RepID=Q232W6_TETTS|nr:ribosomal protein L7Ae containing protein [Tetrahymena thermophila SB210]EAR91714.3 ribosomal protein L7Ae containing protein [Tetrahymena thermophila SB210]|eukprot:XP_001011959.3 ribosomal protein L7Ae containing protein [Tetrahymena thermophila SB210]